MGPLPPSLIKWERGRLLSPRLSLPLLGSILGVGVTKATPARP